MLLVYYIVVDTNFLNISYKNHADFTKFDMNKNYYMLQELLHSPQCRPDCVLCIPELVISELMMHRQEAFENQLVSLQNTVMNFGRFCSFNCGISLQDYEAENLRQFEEFLSQQNIIKIGNCGPEYFHSIIDAALKKTPPFEGVTGKSDKGFKDSVIWYSIIQFAERTDGEYIFVTNDDIFYKNNNQRQLENQFLQHTGCTIHFCKTIDNVKQHVLQHKAEKYIDSVEIVESERSWEFTTGDIRDVSVSWVIPKLKGSDASIILINSEIDRIYNSILDEWKLEHKTRIEHTEEQLHYVDNLQYNVLFNKNGKLCIRFERYAYYEEGIHGMPYWIARVFDLNTGNILEISDLMPNYSGDLLTLIKERAIEDKKNRPELYSEHFSIHKYKRLKDFKFYYDEAGTHIYFEPYEAGCYASGFINFLLLP